MKNNLFELSPILAKFVLYTNLKNKIVAEKSYAQLCINYIWVYLDAWIWP